MRKPPSIANPRPKTGSERVDADRRTFVLGALSALPAATVLAACGDGDPSMDPTDAIVDSSGARRHGIVSAHERNRRRRLCAAHVAEENQHDIDGLMKTFARNTEVSVNGFVVTDRELIRAGHVGGGFSDAPGALANLRVVPEIEYVTDDEIVYEGRLIGQHVAEMNQFPPTQREVSIPYVAFYRFDRAGKLVSERLTFNYGVLSPTPPSPT
jgi:hypothetical protein